MLKKPTFSSLSIEILRLTSSTPEKLTRFGPDRRRERRDVRELYKDYAPINTPPSKLARTLITCDFQTYRAANAVRRGR